MFHSELLRRAIPRGSANTTPLILGNCCANTAGRASGSTHLHYSGPPRPVASLTYPSEKSRWNRRRPVIPLFNAQRTCAKILPHGRSNLSPPFGTRALRGRTHRPRQGSKTRIREGPGYGFDQTHRFGRRRRGDGGGHCAAFVRPAGCTRRICHVLFRKRLRSHPL